MNRLSNESSPYLRQHASNPVDWYPWGDEAFTKAKAEDKPVFLSIGYSSCHWCHVMEHESFQRDDVAALMNKYFICIKVDREEHPAIDALYMTVTQLMTQRGGWPNSVWLTPDARPWYAGTYFPREDRGGRMGFMSLLTRLGTLWNERRADVEEQAGILTEAIKKQHETNSSAMQMTLELPQLLKLIQQQFLGQFDPRYGGFGDAPKFPPHSSLLMLLKIVPLAVLDESSVVINKTLDAMLRGGIYDQVGGGFHRYSTDERWLLPHFEKMLYDNALLMKAYARAFQSYQNPAYRRIVMESCEWLAREMTHPDGGFYAALDADSDGEEGKFYTWSHDELLGLLEPGALKEFCSAYQILPGGNFIDEATGHSTGLNIPHLSSEVDEETVKHLSSTRAKLLDQRSQRVRPGLDDKVIAGWNGLMISALATAGSVFSHPPFIDIARKARRFIDQHLAREDLLARCWCKGSASSNDGVLEDYAAIALADLDLFEATGDDAFRDAARKRVSFILTEFYDVSTGELYMTGNRTLHQLMRMKDLYDQGSPSGIGLAVQAFTRTGLLVNDHELVHIGIQLAEKHMAVIQRLPSAVSSLIEGYITGLEARLSDRTAPGHVQFRVASDTLTFDRHGTAQLELSCKLPDGWHLNNLEHENQHHEMLIRLQSISPGCEIGSIEQTGELTWTSVITSAHAPDQLPDTIAVEVHYQPCTEQECLPVAVQTFSIHTRQRDR